MPDADLGARSFGVGVLRIGGLGGTFRGRVRYPRVEPVVPTYNTRKDYMRHLKPSERWRGGLPLSIRSAIFPEDAEALWHAELVILVSHKAPQTAAMKGKGFQGLDELLDVSGARLCVHGHHHTSHTEAMTLPTGRKCIVRGLALGEVWRLPEDLLS